MEAIRTSEQIGRAVRRMRRERGMSRAQLSALTGIGTRTIYALEAGESVNFGLGKLLAVFEALGLTLYMGLTNEPASQGAPARQNASSAAAPAVAPHWDDLGDLWKLD